MRVVTSEAGWYIDGQSQIYSGTARWVNTLTRFFDLLILKSQFLRRKTLPEKWSQFMSGPQLDPSVVLARLKELKDEAQ